MTVSQTSRSLIGRGVIIVFPLVIIAMVVMVLFMVLPTRYHYQVNNGKLGLWVSRFGWLDAQQSKALEPVPVGNANFGDLTRKAFGTEGEAVEALNTFVTSGIEDRKKRIYPLEREIAGLYVDLVAYLQTARNLGLKEGQRKIDVLQSWLDHYRTREWQEYIGGAKSATGSETFPYEMVGRSSESVSAKLPEGKKAEVQGTAQPHSAQVEAHHGDDLKVPHK